MKDPIRSFKIIDENADPESKDYVVARIKCTHYELFEALDGPFWPGEISKKFLEYALE